MLSSLSPTRYTTACRPAFATFAELVCAAGLIEAGGGASPDPGPGPLPPAHPPAQMRISRLSTGHIESSAARAFAGGDPRERRRFALAPVLVRHPAGDLLIDTGLGSHWQAHREALPWLMRQVTQVVPGVPAAHQLAEGGLLPRGLAGIVLTHAHWDHVSGLDDFSEVPVWINAAEQAFIDGGHRSTRVARGLRPYPRRRYDFNGGPYLGFSRSLDLWSDGSVVLVPAPGHTPGSVIVFLALPSGQRLALIGDIVWQMEGIAQQVPKPWLSRLVADHAPAQVHTLILALARLQAAHPALRLLPAHDARALEHLPAWPACMG